MTWLGRIFHTGCERETRTGKAALGLVAGAATGAVLTASIFTAAFSGALGPEAGLLSAITSAMAFWLFVLVFSLVVWAAGLLLIGAPGWWLLHTLGARCQQAAMIYGALLAPAPYLAFMALVTVATDGDLETRIAALRSTSPLLAVFAVVGAAVGWVVARIAYGPVVKP